MDHEIFTFFRPGCAYEATHDFSRLGSKFSAGEKLRFKRAVFGVYDEVYFYEFDPVTSEGTKSWFPLRSEGEKDCARYFAEVEEKSRANQSAETTAVKCPPSNHGSLPTVSHL
jgi:hypothetical protein